MFLAAMTLWSHHQIETRTKTWYGPAIATFQVQFGGNPYDPDQNDVRVRFEGPEGPAIERIAYYDGVGGYKAVLVTPIKGRYIATLYRNGHKMLEKPQEGLLQVTSPLEHGYLHPDRDYKNRFRWDDGTPFYPIGFNLGWQNANFLPMVDQLAKMGHSGINWTRIWSDQWDGKNPWWPQGETVLKGQLWPKALDTWQTLVDACERGGIEFQMVLFNHGAFSSKVNPNWPDHPWNVKQGGFLKDAGDFFTDPEAKRRTKMWLRYAVARYGASPSVMAWELFNEVEWVDARYENRWADIAAWHKEMAEYLRGIDPYQHMVATSSAIEQKDVFAPMDYYQPHTYPSNVLGAVAGANLPKDKPGFFGEFGPPNTKDKQPTVAGLRDGIYGGITDNQAGPAMFWHWDLAETMNLYPEFANAAEVIHLSELASHPGARQLNAKVETAETGDLSFGPGGGWANMELAHFNLPEDLTPARLAKLPGYFQSMNGAHKDMGAGPITLALHAKKPGVLSIHIAEVSQMGADVSLFVDGKLATETKFAAKDKNYAPDAPISAPFPAGNVTIRIENHGSDWVRISDFELTNAGSQASVIGLGESDWMLLRLTTNAGLKSAVGTVTGLSISDGNYRVTTIDLDSGMVKNDTMKVANFSLPNFAIGGHDVVLIFKRQ